MNKVKKVMREKKLDDSYCVYYNEFTSEKDGKDLMIVSFYQDSGWLGRANEFSTKYEEVFGKGTFDKFLKEWESLTHGKQTELWSFREDLSGIDGELKSSKN